MIRIYRPRQRLAGSTGGIETIRNSLSAQRGSAIDSESEFFAQIAELQLELPAFERRHHASEFVP